MLERLEDRRLAPEAPQRVRLIDQPVVHHLQRDARPLRHIQRFVDDAHAAAADTLNDLIAVNVLAAKPVELRMSEAVGHHVGQDDAQIGMPLGQHVEVRRRQLQRTHRRLGDDIGRSWFVGDQAHLADDVARAELADRRAVLRRVADPRPGHAAQDEQQELGGIALLDQVVAGRVLAELHDGEQFGERARAENREGRRSEEDPVAFGVQPRIGVLAGQFVGGVELVQETAKPGNKPTRAVIALCRRFEQQAQLVAKLDIPFAGLVQKGFALNGIAGERLAAQTRNLLPIGHSPINLSWGSQHIFMY